MPRVKLRIEQYVECDGSCNHYSGQGPEASHRCCHFRSKTNDRERPHDLAASPFVCFAPEVQTRMTAKEATIDLAHMLVTGNTINLKSLRSIIIHCTCYII